MSDQPVVEPDIQILELSWITRDPELQVRDGLNDDLVGQYAQDMMASVSFPPVVVYWDGEQYWLSQGFHRCAAAEAAELTTILAEIRQGTRQEARVDAAGSNRDFDVVGQRRTNADKRRAVKMVLEEQPAWSDRRIAEHVGVDPTWVGRQRKKASTVDGLQLNPPTRIGADGKVRPAHPTKSVQAPPVSPHAPSDCDSVAVDQPGSCPNQTTDTLGKDDNVNEVVVDRPDEAPKVESLEIDRPDEPPIKVDNINLDADPPQPVTPAPVSLASRPKPVSLTPGSAPTPTPTRLPVLQQTKKVITPRRRRFLIDLNFADVTARAIRAAAPPEFVRELVEKLADDNDLIEIVQRLIMRRVVAAAFGDADEADCPTCVIPLKPERAVRALQVGFHPDDLRYMADLILKVTEDAEGAPDEASASLDGKVSREITPGAGDEE